MQSVTAIRNMCKAWTAESRGLIVADNMATNPRVDLLTPHDISVKFRAEVRAEAAPV
jgi:hypothetical protein